MSKLIKPVRCFNMIEILLALTVIAIGMTSILGLFPVGLNASRDAVAENCSADIADQLITYFRVINESDNGTNYNTNFVGSGYSDSKYSGTDIETLSNNFLTAYKAGNTVVGSTPTITNFPRVADGWAIFSSIHNGMFFVIQGPNCTANQGKRSIDYSAMVLIWKSTVQTKVRRFDDTTWSEWPDSAASAAYTYSAALNIELSWPLELPYSERKKHYYQIIIVKPAS
ncbi:MAG: hypothetical protein PHH77_00760 [Victivallaceae bacterium]|nr:hypothetical protein [Victivallaceae bacterium]